ncbi:hypothetical protein RRG08_037556 [Elysia crispata]|uniref:Uncharacterized protein n=1 Tax=Elysia crispata TaxID=231223 RepID=A0AAE0Y6G4_9GAST|nr:hypothetical protein RRG08_037556 [Elysia crispata]
MADSSGCPSVDVVLPSGGPSVDVVLPSGGPSVDVVLPSGGPSVDVVLPSGGPSVDVVHVAPTSDEKSMQIFAAIEPDNFRCFLDDVK